MRRIALAVALVIAAVWPPAALAVPAWLGPEDLSGSDEVVSGRQVAVDDAGNAVVVWQRNDDIIRVAVRDAGGPWQPAEDLSAPSGAATRPDVALDAAGNAIAVWEHRVGGGYGIMQSSFRPAGGDWQAVQDASPPSTSANEAQVAFDAAGNAIAVWVALGDPDNFVMAAVRPAASGIWQTAEEVSPPTGFSGPQLAVDPSGNAVVIWSRHDGTNERVEAAFRPAGGDWQAPEFVSAEGVQADDPQVALDPAGNAIAVWKSQSGDDQWVEKAMRTAGTESDWESLDDLSDRTFGVENPQVAVDPAGNAIALWEQQDETDGFIIVTSAFRPPSAGWQDPVDVSPAGQDSTGARVAVDGDGNTFAVWIGFDDDSTPNDVVQGVIRPAGGGWGAPQDLSGQLAQRSELAVDPEGNALVIWNLQGTPQVLQAAPYDATAPVLRGLSVPTNGTAGAAAGMSVNPYDLWSPLAGAPSWTFGDGGGASGTNVSHAYAAPGTYTVTVSQADTLGFVTTATRQIVIAPAPVVSQATGVIEGTSGNDVLRGTPGPDIIRGLGGNDRILGLGGDDVLIGGPGNDTIVGGPGDDVLLGQAGKDQLLAKNAGTDLLDGGKGRDSGTWNKKDSATRVENRRRR